MFATLLNIKGATIDNAEFLEDTQGCLSFRIRLHVNKKKRCRCPICGRICSVYDHAYGESAWRGMDFGPVSVYLLCNVPRVSCPEHGVVTAAVPWAKHGSRFTTDFAYSAAWMLKGGLSKKRVSEWLQIDWKTVGRLVKLVWNDLESDTGNRLDGKIRRHEKHILNTIRFGLSNARIEATNNKIKLLIRIAYGFHDIDTMIGLIMLFCSQIVIPWPGRDRKTQ